jgi:hypothetical protein
MCPTSAAPEQEKINFGAALQAQDGDCLLSVSAMS